MGYGCDRRLFTAQVWTGALSDGDLPVGAMRTLTEAEARALPGTPPLGVRGASHLPFSTRGAFPFRRVAAR